MDNDIKKVSLEAAASAVTRTLEFIEEGGDPDGGLVEALGDVLADVSSGVDRRIHFLDMLGSPRSGDKSATGLIGKYEELAAEYKAKAESLKNLRARLHERTMEIMDANPEVEFKGRYGKFRQQKNSMASLETEFSTDSRTFSHIVSAETMELYGLHKYITYSEVFQLNTEAVRQALNAGEKLPWATLKQGKHLRISR